MVAAVLACVQWIPQIILTYKKKAAGAFSMTAMLIQCPGCAISLGVTIASGNAWQTWIQWIANLVLELILCIQLIYYEGKKCAEKRRQSKAPSQDVSIVRENSVMP